MRVLCPAKINLFLSVGPLDTRGYHPIRTIFQAIGLFDELLVARREGEAAASHLFVCDSPEVPEDNTVTKALRLLAEIAQVPPLRIELKKRIPTQSGLGGGSSDAAGLIRAINRFLPAPIADHHLMDVAVAVGADVPFFLVGGLAMGQGYGERLTALPDDPTVSVVVVRPREGVSTKDAYAKLDEAPREWLTLDEPFEPYNDFERVMPCACADWIDRMLVRGARSAHLSGSGSAVYGIFDGSEQAEGAAQRLREEWTRSYADHTGEIPVWVTRTLTRAESLHIENL